jgi:hypothetical protein
MFKLEAPTVSTHCRGHMNTTYFRRILTYNGFQKESAQHRMVDVAIGHLYVANLKLLIL